jgi:hypothetical protein
MLRPLLALGAAAIVSIGAACTPAPQHGSSISPGQIPPPLVAPNAPTQPPSTYTLLAAPPVPQRGSSTPTGQNQPPLVTPNVPTQAPPTYALPAAPPPAREPGGRIVQSPSGLGVTSGGTPGYQTMTTPGGGSAVIVPSGGGTSTVIHSGGLIETVPTPR